MVRNMNLIRNILLVIEKSNINQEGIEVKIEKRTDQEIAYHIMLLNEAGLIVAKQSDVPGKNEWKVIRLTWEGHNYLDELRDRTFDVMQ